MSELMDQELREYLDAHFEWIHKRFDGIERRFDGMDRRFDQMAERSEGLEAMVRRTRVMAEGISRDLDHILEMLRRVSRREDELAQMVHAGFSGIKEDLRRLAKLNSRVDRLDRARRPLRAALSWRDGSRVLRASSR